MSKRAAEKAYAKAGIKPNDVQVVELHGNSDERTKKSFLRGIHSETLKQNDQLSLEHTRRTVKKFIFLML